MIKALNRKEKKAQKALLKILKTAESSRFDITSICESKKVGTKIKYFVTNGRVMVWGDELPRFLPDHRIVDSRVPDADIIIDKAQPSKPLCEFDWEPLDRIKDAPVAINPLGDVVAVRPFAHKDEWIGDYKKTHIVINTLYLDMAYDLGFVRFSWTGGVKDPVISTNGLGDLKMLITPITIIS